MKEERHNHDKVIRKAVNEDRQSILDLIQNAVTDMESKEIYQWDSIYPNENVITADIANQCLYVFEDNKIIKGIMVLNEYEDEEYKAVKWKVTSGKHLIIHRLCIEPKYQGRGIARKLMAFAEEYGKYSGYTAIRLDAFVENKIACNLYINLGYEIVGTVHFRKGEFYCMEKAL